MAWNAGISVQSFTVIDDDGPTDKLVISSIHDGDWIAAANADFNEGASLCTAWVVGTSAGEIEIRMDDPNGEILGILTVPHTGTTEHWTAISTNLANVKGIHDVYFVFRGESDKELFQFGAWQFIR